MSRWQLQTRAQGWLVGGSRGGRAPGPTRWVGHDLTSEAPAEVWSGSSGPSVTTWTPRRGKKWRKGHLQPEEPGGGCRKASPGLLRGSDKSNGGPGDPGLAKVLEAASVQGTNRGQDSQSPAAAGTGA